jgi:putative transposase
MAGPTRTRPRAANALTADEQEQVLAVLTSERFVDKSVAQVWATLLAEGTYMCSQSTMHRILHVNHAAGDRRSQARHPPRTVPELHAARPGQVWSWDITKLKRPQRGVYYDLYVILDVFSRYVVGWTVAAREDSAIAKELMRPGSTSFTRSTHTKRISPRCLTRLDRLRCGHAPSMRHHTGSLGRH